jgi:hypothetical protein
MKLAWIAAALLAATACEQAPSRLDKMPAPAGAPSGGGDLDARVARLEKKLGKVDEEALKFLATAYQARLDAEARQKEEQANRPQPGVVYGVDIQPNIQLGQVEGSPEALVTIIEAWDFA